MNITLMYIQCSDEMLLLEQLEGYVTHKMSSTNDN